MRNHPLHNIEMRAAAVATIAIALAASCDPAFRPVRASEENPPGQTQTPAATLAKRAFIGEIHRSLKANDDRLSSLAKRVLDVPSYGARLSDRLVNMRVEEKSAEANYLNAKLNREVAEIAVREYTEGIFVQDEQTVEMEIKLAESDLMRARDMVEYADQVGASDAAKIQTRLNEQGKASILEAAEMKKKSLHDYTAPRRIKELESDVAKGRSDELVKKAEWERLQRRMETIEKAITADQNRTDVKQRSLSLVGRAIQIDTQVHAKLDQFVKITNSDNALQKEIRDLTNELRTIVNEAEAVHAADEFASLKSRIREAARRKGVAASN